MNNKNFSAIWKNRVFVFIVAVLGGSVSIASIMNAKNFFTKVYATESFVIEAIRQESERDDCKEASRDIRIIKIFIWQMEEEIQQNPNSRTLKDELKEEEYALERAKKVHYSEKCRG